MEEDLLSNPVFARILQDYVNRAEVVFRREVQAQGKVLTGEMLQSIKATAIERGTGFIQASVHFDMILRLKDLKSLNFTRTPPIAAMREFVEQVGINNFAYIPGYKNGIRPTDAIAVNRVAWGIKSQIKREPNVKRGYRGLYNDPLKNEILPLFFNELRQNAGLTALSHLRLMFTDK